jgi:isopentenyl phosphate kinase
MSDLLFLKLGGSLITDKTVPFTPRMGKITEIASEIAESRRTHPDLSLVLGHGSGSFGHTAGRKYGTRQGVRTVEEWSGFAEVWYQASELNRKVMSALASAGVATVAFAPVASVLARDGQVARWDLEPLHRALEAGILPVVYGDVVFDEVRGGTILSTEDLFTYLARELGPKKILLAGLEEGVWADFPARREIVGKITPESFNSIMKRVGAGLGEDVTGGMESKVELMLGLVQSMPGMTAQLFSGEKSGQITKALEGKIIGTLISAM